MEIWNAEWSDVINTAISIAVGFLISYYFYRSAKVVHRLSYSRFKKRIIDIDSIDGKDRYKFYAGDVETKVLFREYILLQNTGNKSFVFADQLTKIEFKGDDITTIFSTTTVHDNEARERFQTKRSPENRIEIHFEFLRRGESVLFMIDHNCRTETDFRINSFELDAIQHKKLSRYIYGLEFEKTLQGFFLTNMVFSATAVPFLAAYMYFVPPNNDIEWFLPVWLLLAAFIPWIGWRWTGKVFSLLPGDIAVRKFHAAVRQQFGSR